jgi:hypothetical protein
MIPPRELSAWDHASNNYAELIKKMILPEAASEMQAPERDILCGIREICGGFFYPVFSNNHLIYEEIMNSARNPTGRRGKI